MTKLYARKAPAPRARKAKAVPAAPAHVFLACPHYGSIDPDALPGLTMASGRERVSVRLNGASLLAHNFNRLLVDCLNERGERGYTHFAMMHSDQGAPAGWLDTLLDEMARTGADVVSVAVPIKDHRGLTSTGVRSATGGVRRLTLREIYALPETFGAADVCGPGEHLAVNTGLWLWRHSAAMDDFPGFTIADRIVRCPDGKLRAAVLPEDWGFSTWAHEQGLRVFATRKVRVTHYGRWGFPNDGPHGQWATDEGDRV